jgi:hypothetical protein
MGQTSQNIDQTAGDWAWRQSPGLRNPNPVPTDAPTQSTLAPVPPLAVKFNQVTPVPSPNRHDQKAGWFHGVSSGTYTEFFDYFLEPELGN